MMATIIPAIPNISSILTIGLVSILGKIIMLLSLVRFYSFWET